MGEELSLFIIKSQDKLDSKETQTKSKRSLLTWLYGEDYIRRQVFL